MDIFPLKYKFLNGVDTGEEGFICLAMCRCPGFPFSFNSVVSHFLIYVQNYPVSIFSADSEGWAVCIYIKWRSIITQKSLLRNQW